MMNNKFDPTRIITLIDKETTVGTDYSATYYPREFPVCLKCDGRRLLVSHTLINEGLKQTGAANLTKADLVGGTNLKEGSRIDFFSVIPKKMERVFEFAIPEWFGYIKNQAKTWNMFIDLESGGLTTTLPDDKNSPMINIKFFDVFAEKQFLGKTIYMGVNGKEQPLAFWTGTEVYNPFSVQNPFTLIVMPMKMPLDTGKIKENRIFKEIKVSEGRGLEIK